MDKLSLTEGQLNSNKQEKMSLRTREDKTTGDRSSYSGRPTPVSQSHVHTPAAHSRPVFSTSHQL